MIRANYLMIAADERLNRFMKAADLFEQGKVLGIERELQVDYKEETELTLKRAEIVVRAMDKYEQKGTIISMVHLVCIQIGDAITHNQSIVKPFINKEVRIISSGSTWFMLDDYLRFLGFSVETDEHRYIKNIL